MSDLTKRLRDLAEERKAFGPIENSRFYVAFIEAAGALEAKEREIVTLTDNHNDWVERFYQQRTRAERMREVLEKIAYEAGQYADGAPDSHYLAKVLLEIESMARGSIK